MASPGYVSTNTIECKESTGLPRRDSLTILEECHINAMDVTLDNAKKRPLESSDSANVSDTCISRNNGHKPNLPSKKKKKSSSNNGDDRSRSPSLSRGSASHINMSNSTQSARLYSRSPENTDSEEKDRNQTVDNTRNIDVFDSSYSSSYTVFLRYQDVNSNNKSLNILKVSCKLESLHIGHKLIENYSRNTWKLTFDKLINANRCLQNSTLRKEGFISYIPGYVKCRQGVVRDIDLDINLEDLKNAINAGNPDVTIIKAFRLKRKNKLDGKWIESESVCLSFKGQRLPSKIFVWHCALNVSCYIPPTRICFRCGKLGHLGRFCNNPERCLRCSEDHVKDPECSKELLCINCKGNHRTLDRNCPVLQKSNEINKVMANNNLPFFEARKQVESLQKTPSTRIFSRSNGPGYKEDSPPKSYAAVASSRSPPKNIYKNINSKPISLVNKEIPPDNSASLEFFNYIQPIFKYFESLNTTSRRKPF